MGSRERSPQSVQSAAGTICPDGGAGYLAWQRDSGVGSRERSPQSIQRATIRQSDGGRRGKPGEPAALRPPDDAIG